MGEIKVGDGSVVVSYDDDGADYQNLITVEVNGSEIKAWTIVSDPEAEAAECAGSYQAVWDASRRSVVSSEELGDLETLAAHASEKSRHGGDMDARWSSGVLTAAIVAIKGE